MKEKKIEREKNHLGGASCGYWVVSWKKKPNGST